MSELRLYAVRNQEGQWFRAKGYGGYGKTWVDDIMRAKLYTHIGQARSRVTYFATEWPEYGIPNIVEFTVTESRVLDEQDRVGKAQERKQITEAKREGQDRKRRLESAKRDYERAMQLIAELQSKPQEAT